MRELLALIVLVSLAFGAGFWVNRLGERTFPEVAAPMAPQSQKTTPSDTSVTSPDYAERLTLAEELVDISELEQRVALLRSRGFPDDGILLLLWVSGSRDSERYWIPAGFPWWKSWHGPSEPTQEEIERGQKYGRELRSLLGAAGLTPYDLRRAIQRYGVADPDKIFQLREIRVDYNALENRIRSMPEEEQAEAYRLMREERSRDIQAILTAEEFATYQLRTSPGIRSLESQLRDIDFTVGEFESLIPIWSQLSPEVPRLGEETRSDEEKRAAEFLIDEHVREALGEERYWEFKLRNDRKFEGLASFAQAHDLSHEQVLVAWDEQVSREFDQVITGSLAPPESAAEQQLRQARLIEIWGRDVFDKAREDRRLFWLVGSSEGGDG